MYVKVLIASATVVLLVIIAVMVFLKKYKPEKRLQPVLNSVQKHVSRKTQLVRNKGTRIRANVLFQNQSSFDDTNLQIRDQDVENFL